MQAPTKGTSRNSLILVASKSSGTTYPPIRTCLPSSSVTTDDFAAIAPQIDELIREQGQIRLLIAMRAKSFLSGATPFAGAAALCLAILATPSLETESEPAMDLAWGKLVPPAVEVSRLRRPL